jgi:hypothetical protein
MDRKDHAPTAKAGFELRHRRDGGKEKGEEGGMPPEQKITGTHYTPLARSAQGSVHSFFLRFVSERS